jgi:hypothetical protein
MPLEGAKHFLEKPGISIPWGMEARMYGVACGGDRPEPGGRPEGGVFMCTGGLVCMDFVTLVL